MSLPAGVTRESWDNGPRRDLPPSLGGMSAPARRKSIPNAHPPRFGRSQHYTPPHETDVSRTPSRERAGPPRKMDVTSVKFRGREPIVPGKKKKRGPVRIVPEHEVAKGFPPPVGGHGVRVTVRNDDGRVLAPDRAGGNGHNLLGGIKMEDETPREAAIRFLDEQAGLETDDVVEV